MNKIANEYRDADGYWIELKAGWHAIGEYALHGIIAGTKREARQRAKEAEQCDCSDCQRLMKEISCKL